MLVVGIVVHGSDGKGKVPNGFGVYVVDGYFENLVVPLFDGAVGVIHGNAVAVAVYRHRFGKVGKLYSADVGEVQFAVGGTVKLHFLTHDEIEQVVRRHPILQHFAYGRGNDGVVHGVYRLLLRPILQRAYFAVGNERGRQLCVLFRPRDEAFVQKEHFHVGGKQIAVNVALFVCKHLIFVGVAGSGIVRFQLLAEQLAGLAEVLHHFGVRRAYVLPLLFQILRHGFLGKHLGNVVVQHVSDSVDKSVYPCAGSHSVLFFKLILLVFVGSLGAVLVQPHYVGGVDGAAAGIGGIEIHVKVEEHVLYGKGRAVRELYVVFKHEIVGGRLIHVGGTLGDYFQILCHHRFAVAVNGIAFFVVGNHAYLRHAHNVAVHSRSGKERIEYLVHFLRGKHYGIGFVVVVNLCRVGIACGKSHKTDAKKHHYRKRHAQNFGKSACHFPSSVKFLYVS